MSRAACPVCESVHRAMLCASCASARVFQEDGRRALERLRQERNALLAQLELRLQQRARWREQQLTLRAAREAATLADRQRRDAELELQDAQAALQRRRDALTARRNRIQRAQQQLASSRADVLGSQLPTLLRYQSLTRQHVSSMLMREQRVRMRQLLDLLPMRITALRRNGGGPIKTTICDLQLPDSLAPPPGGAWPDPQAASAAAGYLLLLVEQIAQLMGGPMLHEGRYQGSTSTVWQPRSFWHRQPVSGQALPLHVMPSGGSSGGGAGASFVRAGGWGSARAPAAERLEGSSSCDLADGSGGGAASGDVSGPKAAYDLLMRSITCMLSDKAHTFGLQLKPSSWTAAAWLVVFSAVVKRDPKHDGQLVAASTMLSLDALGGEAAADGGSGGGGATPWDPDLWGGQGEEEDDEVEGWGIVRTPCLPPPPSHADEVEQWDRAMHSDGNAAAAMSAMTAVAAIELPSSGSVLPMERIRSLFSRQ